MRRIVKWLAAVAAVLVAGTVIAWATSPDPTGNPASFEDVPLDPRLAPMDEALTLAQFESETDAIATLLVTGFDGEQVTGVDLAGLGATRTGNPLLDLASIDLNAISQDTIDDLPTLTMGFEYLLPSAPGGAAHIGTGTNFPEHAEEANSGSVFQFPKFGTATPARTTIRAREGILLDYEVELCMRFDRDIASLADFDAAVKGVFLCGDFTNRNVLVQLADTDNLDSGFGFSDAKSGTGHYPSGPFIVVPRDWKSFVANLRMTTSVNGDPRQDARGGEMTLDFRALAEKALGDMAEPRFFYAGGFQPLAPEGRITTDMTLMSGTSEGVIFTPPSRADMIEGIVAYILRGGPLARAGLVNTVKREFIANEVESGHFLKPGDTVVHGSNHLGDIIVEVTG